MDLAEGVLVIKFCFLSPGPMNTQICLSHFFIYLFSCCQNVAGNCSATYSMIIIKQLVTLGGWKHVLLLCPFSRWMLKKFKYLEKHWCELWSVHLTKCPGCFLQQVFQGTSSVQCISTGALSVIAGVPNTVTACSGYCCFECQCSCKFMAESILCLWMLLPVSQVSLQGLWMLSLSVQGSVVVSATAGVSLPLSWMPLTVS